MLDLLKIEKPVIVSPSMSGRFALPLVTEEPSGSLVSWRSPPWASRSYQESAGPDHGPGPGRLGRERRLIPLEQADLLVNSVQRGRKVIIPGGSHAPYMSDPAAFHAELLKFLRELD